MNKQHLEFLVEGNTKEELAMQLLKLMPKEAIASIQASIKEYEDDTGYTY